MPLRKTLDGIRSAPIPPNEQEVITTILLILRDLGWNPFGPEVRQEYRVGGGRIDIALAGPQRIVAFIEAKAPRENLDRHVDQVVKYAFREGVDICVLTNGLEWWLYVPMERVPFEERRFAILRTREDPVERLQDGLESFLGRENLVSGKALRLARRRYKLDRAIPNAWREIVTGPDDALLDLVSQRVFEEVGLRPTREEVADSIRCRKVPPPQCEKPVTPPPERPQPGARKPTGIRLWGEYLPVRSGNEVLLRTAEGLSRRHPDDFADRVLKLSWASRRIRDRWKAVGSTGIFLNVNFKVVELIRRSEILLEHFGYPRSDLEILDG